MITRFGMSTTPPRSRAPNLKLEDQTSESGKHLRSSEHASSARTLSNGYPG
uniref:Uncharacterized protein n=1 Tax=Moniliophthora roreri TaxID=221103 RepID=A0A0W0FYU7_MONRR